MRILHLRDDYVGGRIARSQSPSDAKRDRWFHGRQYLPLWDLLTSYSRNSESGERTGRDRNRKGGGAMSTSKRLDFSLEPERYELSAASAYVFDLDRREFFKFFGAGVLLVSVLQPTAWTQESGQN